MTDEEVMQELSASETALKPPPKSLAERLADYKAKKLASSS